MGREVGGGGGNGTVCGHGERAPEGKRRWSYAAVFAGSGTFVRKVNSDAIGGIDLTWRVNDIPKIFPS